MSAWMLARAAGLTAYLAFSIATIAGLMLSGKYLGKKSARNLTLVHEASSIAGLLLVVVHAWAILNDAFFEFSLARILVPGLSPYAPLWVGMGIISAYLAVIAIGSFYLRKRIGPRTWRRIHYSTPFAFAGMTLHGVMAGTDSSNLLVLGMYSAITVTVVTLMGYRIVTAIRGRAEKQARKEAALRRAAAKRSSIDQTNPQPAGARS